MACMDVCPLASELCVVNSNILCPEEGCGKTFKASSALNMHLTKHHRNSCLAKRDTSVTVRYFCPEEKCVYHVNANRHFTQMKYLKQHYLKVHSEKRFNCESCSKAFATQELLRYHLQVCGIKFTCSCGNSYSSYEALLTHSKRKQHTFDDKFKSGNKRSKGEVTDSVLKKDAHCFSLDMMQPVYILPKFVPDQIGASVAVNVLTASTLSDLSTGCTLVVEDKSMQTDPVDLKRKKTSPNKALDKTLKRRASAHTQTGSVTKSLYPKKTAETQTMGDYILKKAMADANILLPERETTELLPMTVRKRRSNSGTQTGGRKCLKVAAKFNEPVLEQGLDAMSLSPCSPFCLKKDVGLPDLWVGDKNTSSTQTGPVPDVSVLQSENFTQGNNLHNDLNLDLFGQDGSLCSTSNLQSLFEDNSDSFDNVVNGTSHFDAAPHPANVINSLDEIPNGNLTACNITQSDQNLNHLFPRHPSDEEAQGVYTMRTTTETQTTDDLADLDSLLYTNMWTQTPEDSLFSGLDFADIETQTAWPLYSDEVSESILVSAETQTAISSSAFSTCSSAIDNQCCWSQEASHIETQTCEEDLKELMAEFESALANKTS
ncbi:uncharacterized protein LOC117644357 [Thrips palmi]|uniref:Uncharacterized protein LOC117644357 n=1 Tax=Thrips palmi TaxID=161013 RepID=A0A6P8YRJ4_THRPL|nr:uncharacterized protein LOC117644357 [Thrips palmi]